LSASLLQTAVLASYSIAGIFPFVKYDDYVLVNGALLKNLEIAAAVNQCREMNGNDDANIHIDVIMMTSKVWTPVEVTNKTAMQMFFIADTLSNYRSTMYDLQKAQFDYTDINFRYLVSPQASLPNPTSNLPFDFNSDDINFLITQGNTDAQNAISQGSGVAWNEYYQVAHDYLVNTFGKNATIQKDAEHDNMVEMLRNAFAEETARWELEQELIIDN